MTDHPYHGVYLDRCSPHYRRKTAWLATAALVSIGLWGLLIAGGMAVVRYLNGWWRG